MTSQAQDASRGSVSAGSRVGPGRPTRVCRFFCTALVAWPLVYFQFVTDGNAYLFLVLVLLAPIAGSVLALNSVFCMIRHRRFESPLIGLLFVAIGVVGFLLALEFLPQFRM